MKTFVAHTPLGYEVAFTEESWNHIVARGHDMMEGNEEAIKDTLTNPNCVFESSEHPESRHVYFGKSAKASYGEKFLTKVIVEVPNEYNNIGKVVSAWPQKEVKGGINQGGLCYVKYKP